MGLEMNRNIRTHNFGFPRIGAKRELKRALESTWARRITKTQLVETAKAIRAEYWRAQRAVGIDLIPSNDFSLYDQMLDTIALVGAVPEQFHWRGSKVKLATYFAMARSVTGNGIANADCSHGGPATALEMTKWFDANYHYVVPELNAEQTFQMTCTKPFDEFAEALALSIRTMPVIVGPLTFLLLANTRGQTFDRLSLLPKLLPVYAEVLQRLQKQGAEWVQLDEPALCLDQTPEQRVAFTTAYVQLRENVPGLKILLATYLGELHDNLTTAASCRWTRSTSTLCVRRTNWIACSPSCRRQCSFRSVSWMVATSGGTIFRVR